MLHSKSKKVEEVFCGGGLALEKGGGGHVGQKSLILIAQSKVLKEICSGKQSTIGGP
jgi:hypothetical protein